MSTYLERYQNGEYEQVWDELIALGAQVRQEPFYSDALAVARATMRRVLSNLKMLIPRLETIGYVFETSLQPGEADTTVFAPPSHDIHLQLDKYEKLVGSLPLSLYAWYEIVGAVNLVGKPPQSWGALDQGTRSQQYRQFNGDNSTSHADQQRQGSLPHFIIPNSGFDPLEVDSLTTQFQWYQLHQEGITMYGASPDDCYRIMIAPDFYHKYQISGGGGYEMDIPNLTADGILLHEWHNTTFIEYLRLCFRWGGLSGLDALENPPREAISLLTSGFLPF